MFMPIFIWKEEQWFRIANMNVPEVYLLGLGLGMSFSSKLYLLVFFIESSNELISYVIYIHFIPSMWIQMDINYMSGSA